MKKIKKYSDFILALIVLIFAVVAAVVVVSMVFKKNGGSFFPKAQSNTEQKVAITKKTTKKTASSYSDEDDSVGTIFIGDSRTVGLNKAVDIEAEDRQFVVAKVGKGYDWFVKSGLPEIKKIKAENTALTKWRYVVNLGVNDLGNIDKYLEEYNKLTDDDSSIQLVLVSVNPVKDYPTVTNSSIKKFNAKLMDAGYDYIDTYSALVKKGYSTVDGLHYTDETYDDIYDLIKSGLKDL
jgi:cytochrome oxidase Cu insertion factor (SCO1/SenC/PrrC family)